MTQNEKLGWGIGATIIVLLAITYRNQIGSWWNNMTGTGSETRLPSENLPQTRTVVQPVVVPVQIPSNYNSPVPNTCEEVRRDINAIKNRLVTILDPYQKQKLQNILDGFNKQYAIMGCMGGAPPNPNSAI